MKTLEKVSDFVGKYMAAKTLTFSSVFIIASPFPSDMLWDKSIRKIKRPCPLRSVRDKGV